MAPLNGYGSLKVPAQIKHNYRGKNARGGRKCKFSTAQGYLRKMSPAFNHTVFASKDGTRLLPSGIWSAASNWRLA